MKFYFRQKARLITDAYLLCDCEQNVVYEVKSKFSPAKTFIIYEKTGEIVGKVVQKPFSSEAIYGFYLHGDKVGELSAKIDAPPRDMREFVVPDYSPYFVNFTLDYKGWSMICDSRERGYEISAKDGQSVARMTKRESVTDLYEIDVFDPEDLLSVLMLAICIDAHKSRRGL